MPSRNVVKVDIPDSYYHVYLRGAGKRRIFVDDADYTFFLSLFARHLCPDPQVDINGQPYAHLIHDVQLLAYCLMGNHYHLLIYQHSEGGMSKLMRSINITYSRYFNKKYESSGPLFESRYKAAIIGDDSYLLHITRYIHLNPKHWQSYPYSSLYAYSRNGYVPKWLHTGSIRKLFHSTDEYMRFVADYEDYKETLDEIKDKVASNI